MTCADIDDSDRPLGVVLAGGAATRLGGAKATAELAGRPLLAYPLEALARAGLDVVIVAKPDTALPSVDVTIVREAPEPRHPLAGVAAALRHAGGRSVLVLPCDTPFIGPDLVRRLAGVAAPAVATTADRPHPLIAHYPQTALTVLERAVAENRSATGALASLDPTPITTTERETFNVNTPDDLAYAASILTRAL